MEDPQSIDTSYHTRCKKMFLFLITLLFITNIASSSNIHCVNNIIPTLHGTSKTALICYPTNTNTINNSTKFPLHIFAHGNGAGGNVIKVYTSLLHAIASSGFVVAAYTSCVIDSHCYNGETQFLELIKTVQYLETTQSNITNKIDFSLPYSASGHSTGARAVLMLAAAADNPSYLANISYINLTQEDRKTISKITSIVADHPDPMYDPKQNPDILNYHITKMPTMLVTGSLDFRPIGEPVNAAWKDWLLMSKLPNKVFVNIKGATHLNPIFSHLEAPYLVAFVQYHSLGNQTAGEIIYGTTTHSLIQQHQLYSNTSTINNGGMKKEIGFLACGGFHRKNALPSKYQKYCV